VETSPKDFVSAWIHENVQQGPELTADAPELNQLVNKLSDDAARMQISLSQPSEAWGTLEALVIEARKFANSFQMWLHPKTLDNSEEHQ